MAQPHGFDCGKERRDGFADAGRRLRISSPLALNGAVGEYGEVALAGAVFGVGKFECCECFVALDAPFKVDPRPVEVFFNEVGEESGQVFARESAAVFVAFPGVELQIGELYVDELKIRLLGDDKGVDLGLGPMRGVLGRVFFGVGFGGFDFIDEHGAVFFGEQTVDAAAYFEGDLVGFDEVTDRDFGLVVVGAGVLNFLVPAGAFDHAVGAGETAGGEVAGAQYEADEFADGSF